DGRWLAAIGRDGLHVRSMQAPEQVVHALGRADRVTFSRDGERVAWFRYIDNDRVDVTVRSLVGPPEPRTLRIPEPPLSLSFESDDAELWIVDGEWLRRWRPDTGALVVSQVPGRGVAIRAALGADGRTIRVGIDGELWVFTA